MEKKDVEENVMKCDACGHEMWETESQTNLIGIAIKLTITDNASHPEAQRVKDIFGKLEFNVCFVCWLKSLGIKKKEFQSKMPKYLENKK